MANEARRRVLQDVVTANGQMPARQDVVAPASLCRLGRPMGGVPHRVALEVVPGVDPDLATIGEAEIEPGAMGLVYPAGISEHPLQGVALTRLTVVIACNEVKPGDGFD